MTDGLRSDHRSLLTMLVDGVKIPVIEDHRNWRAVPQCTAAGGRSCVAATCEGRPAVEALRSRREFRRSAQAASAPVTAELVAPFPGPPPRPGRDSIHSLDRSGSRPARRAPRRCRRRRRRSSAGSQRTRMIRPSPTPRIVCLIPSARRPTSPEPRSSRSSTSSIVEAAPAGLKSAQRHGQDVSQR